MIAVIFGNDVLKGCFVILSSRGGYLAEPICIILKRLCANTARTMINQSPFSGTTTIVILEKSDSSHRHTRKTMPGRPTNLDGSRARAYCACRRCRWGCLDIFTLNYPFSPLSPSLWETVRYRLKYCLKGPLNPNQPTNKKN